MVARDDGSTPEPVTRLVRFARYRVERSRRVARLTRLGPAVAAARRPKLLRHATRLARWRRGGLGIRSVAASAWPAQVAAETSAGMAAAPEQAPEVPGLSDVEREWLFGDREAALARAVMPSAQMLAPLSEDVRRERVIQRLRERGGLERGRGARIVEGAADGDFDVAAPSPEPAAPAAVPAARVGAVEGTATEPTEPTPPAAAPPRTSGWRLSPRTSAPDGPSQASVSGAPEAPVRTAAEAPRPPAADEEGPAPEAAPPPRPDQGVRLARQPAVERPPGRPVDVAREARPEPVSDAAPSSAVEPVRPPSSDALSPPPAARVPPRGTSFTRASAPEPRLQRSVPPVGGPTSASAEAVQRGAEPRDAAEPLRRASAGEQPAGRPADAEDAGSPPAMAEPSAREPSRVVLRRKTDSAAPSAAPPRPRPAAPSRPARASSPRPAASMAPATRGLLRRTLDVLSRAAASSTAPAAPAPPEDAVTAAPAVVAEQPARVAPPSPPEAARDERPPPRLVPSAAGERHAQVARAQAEHIPAGPEAAEHPTAEPAVTAPTAATSPPAKPVIPQRPAVARTEPPEAPSRAPAATPVPEAVRAGSERPRLRVQSAPFTGQPPPRVRPQRPQRPQRAERAPARIPASPVSSPARGIMRRAADAVRRRPTAATVAPVQPRPAAVSRAEASRRPTPVPVAVAVTAPPPAPRSAAPLAPGERAPAANAVTASPPIETPPPAPSPARSGAAPPRPRPRLSPAPRTVARSAVSPTPVGRMLARAESQGAAGGGGGGGDADAIYDEVLRRLRVEQEQIGRLIPHPF